LEQQKEALTHILRTAERTKYGEFHSFCKIHTIQEFQSSHPLTTYDYFSPWIDRIYRDNEPDVLFPGLPSWFSITTGTTGKPKYLPKKTIQQQPPAVVPLVMKFPLKTKEEEKLKLTIIGNSPLPPSPHGVTVSLVTAYAINKQLETGTHVDGISPSPVFGPNFHGNLYLHCLFALHEPNLLCIHSFLIASVINFFHFLVQNSTSLQADVAAGTVTGPLSEEQRRVAQKFVPPGNPKRAADILAAFSHPDGNLGLGTRLWPHLRSVQCITGGPLSFYDHQLSVFIPNLGTSIIFRSPFYVGSEGIYGFNIWPGIHRSRYALITNDIFYEFIPCENGNVELDRVVDLSGIEVGKSYELVITTPEGLYRYRTGDIIQVVEVFGQGNLAFNMKERLLFEINIGLRFPESVISYTVQDALAKILPSAKVVDYTALPNLETFPPSLEIFVEFTNSVKWEDKGEEILSDKLTQCAEVILEENCPAYICVRGKFRLLVKTVMVDTFLFFLARIKERGRNDNQAKVPHVLKNPDDIRWIESRTQEFRL